MKRKRRRRATGFIQVLREPLFSAKPLSAKEKERGVSDEGLLTYHQIGVLCVLSGLIGRADTIVRTAEGKGPPMTIGEIADFIGCSRQNMHVILKALERAGAVTIEGNTDKRRVIINRHFAHRYGRPRTDPD